MNSLLLSFWNAKQLYNDGFALICSIMTFCVIHLFVLIRMLNEKHIAILLQCFVAYCLRAVQRTVCSTLWCGNNNDDRCISGFFEEYYIDTIIIPAHNLSYEKQNKNKCVHFQVVSINCSYFLWHMKRWKFFQTKRMNRIVH